MLVLVGAGVDAQRLREFRSLVDGEARRCLVGGVRAEFVRWQLRRATLVMVLHEAVALEADKRMEIRKCTAE